MTAQKNDGGRWVTVVILMALVYLGLLDISYRINQVANAIDRNTDAMLAQRAGCFEGRRYMTEQDKIVVAVKALAKIQGIAQGGIKYHGDSVISQKEVPPCTMVNQGLKRIEVCAELALNIIVEDADD